MRQINSACLSLAAIGAVCGLAWWAAIPLETSATNAGSIRYIQLHNASPSPSWSPNGRYLAYHDVNLPKQVRTPFKRSFGVGSGGLRLRRSSLAAYRRMLVKRRALRLAMWRARRAAIMARLKRSSPALYRRLRRSTYARNRYLRRSSYARARYLRRRARRLAMWRARRQRRAAIMARLRSSSPALYRRLRRSTYARNRYLMRMTARGLRRATPSVSVHFLSSSHAQSQLAVLDTHTMRPHWLNIRKLKKGTPSPSAYFHPTWGNNNLLLTGSSFSNKGSVFIFPNGPSTQVPGLSVPHFGAGGRLFVGREHQSGVFIYHIDHPNQGYALVDERRKISGVFPRFSPNGKKLAWIDAGRDYSAAPLKVFSITFTPETLKQAATLWVKDPWTYRKKKHKAIQVKSLAIPATHKVTEFTWAADSETIAFVQGRPYRGYGNYQYVSSGLYILRAGMGKAHLIHAQGRNPSFAPDGSLYFDRPNAGIWRWDPKTNKSHQISRFGEEPRVSPKGDRLAFLRWLPMRRTYNSRLYLGIKSLR